jgi:hypothetical protein
VSPFGNFFFRGSFEIEKLLGKTPAGSVDTADDPLDAIAAE